MGKDLLGGLGNLGSTLSGLMGGLARSGLAPQDDPAVKLLNAQTEVSDLKKQEEALLVEIGRQAFEQNPEAWPQANKLNLIRMNTEAAEARLLALKAEQEEEKRAKEAEQQAKEAETAKGRCPSCGHGNPDGIKFCQECGTKLGATFCVECGVQLKPGVRFCGECGAKQGE